MAKKQVEVGVSVSPGANGKLEIKVKPWIVEVATGDTLEWVPVEHNNDEIVRWMRIDSSVPESMWPFPTTPPDSAYKGDKAKPPKTPDKRKPGLQKGTRVRYVITVAFSDDEGNERVAVIDPDMVMDV